MKNYFESIESYVKYINSEELKSSANKFARIVYDALSKNYNDIEPILVKRIVDGIKNGKIGFSNNGITMNIVSEFIHSYNIPQYGSNPSGVKFECNGRIASKELADMMYIIRFKYNGKTMMEKITFNQVKKDNKRGTWSIDKEQLYLLSRFPEFKGVEGSIIPQREYNLTNNSKTLGTYSMLFNPGDLVYIGANLLERYLNKRKSINLKEILRIEQSSNFRAINPFIEPEFYYYFEDYCYRIFYSKMRTTPYQLFPPVFLNNYSCEYASNTSEFVMHYLKGEIGEVLDSEYSYNTGVNRFVNELIKKAKEMARKTGNKEAENILNEINGGGNNENADTLEEENYEFNGLGIVMTTVSMEGRDKD